MGLASVAIGGIDLQNAALPIEAGADAVAVISGLFGAADPARAARELRAIVHAALARRDAARR
jgi:thiamine-phosphate pyrophosphorylase